jgi:KaiC/GvpD/RAD55 family RecA-like ATPase
MRVSSGTDGIDRLIDGGFPSDRLYVVSGPPGSGKTTFSAKFITAGAQRGEKCLYVSMHETADELVDDMSGFDFPFEAAMDSDRVHFIDATEGGRGVIGGSGRGNGGSGPGNLGRRLAGFIDSKGVDRVVIDSTMLLDHLFGDDTDGITHLLTSFKRSDATVVLISEMTDPGSYSEEHYLAHGVLFFHYYLEATEMTRGVQITKMRGTAIDPSVHPIEFADSGLVVTERPTS